MLGSRVFSSFQHLSRSVRLVAQMSGRSVSQLASTQNGYGGKVQVRTESDVAILSFDRGENRMNDEFIDQVNGAMDEALRNPDLKGIVTTGAGGKFYSNGLDLIWMVEVYKSAPEYLEKFLERWQQLELRMLTCPVVTVAALNGHAFAGGGVLSMCHDFRVMQADRGYWCMNEAQLGLVIPEWINKIFRTKLGGNGARTLTEAVVYGKRYAAAEAKQCGIIDETCSSVELIPRAISLILKDVLPGGQAPSRDYVEKTKRLLYKEAIEASKKKMDFNYVLSRL